MKNITSIFCLSCLLGCLDFSYSFAMEQCTPEFSEKSHDNGEILRHSISLRENIKQKLDTSNQEGMCLPALQQTYQELEKLTLGQTYIDINLYKSFLEKHIDLFSQKGIKIDIIPESLDLTAEKLGRFTLPTSESDTYYYISKIKEQLDIITEKNSKDMIISPLTNKLLNEMDQMMRTSQARYINLKNYLIENHIHLRTIGVVDPSLITH